MVLILIMMMYFLTEYTFHTATCACCEQVHVHA